MLILQLEHPGKRLIKSNLCIWLIYDVQRLVTRTGAHSFLIHNFEIFSYLFDLSQLNFLEI